MILFLMNLVKGSLQDELDYFFKAVNGAEVAIREVTKSAFCKARKKLRHQAFQELSHTVVDLFYRIFSYRTWKGFRVLAIDGSTVQVPDTAEAAGHFGVWNTAAGKPCAVARISHLVDVGNDIILDALISPKEVGERALAERHMQQVREGDIVLFDRGYPAFWIFARARAQGAHFCARMATGVWNVVDTFLGRGLKERIIRLKPTHHALKECKERGLPVRPLKVRLIRIELETGETEVLMTSLVNKEEYPRHTFKELYSLRWGVEEQYKTCKSRLEIENWTGKSIESVYQDFYAKVLTLNLTIAIAQPAKEEIEARSKDKKYPYTLNLTQALSKMKDVVVLLFKRYNLFGLLKQLYDIFIKMVEPIRPGRRYPRKHRIGRRQYHACYKPIR